MTHPTCEIGSGHSHSLVISRRLEISKDIQWKTIMCFHIDVVHVQAKKSEFMSHKLALQAVDFAKQP